MNTELYIARKIVPSRKDKSNISRPVVTFSVIAIALGIMIMLLSIGIVHGFKKNIKEKVFGFGAHIQITNFDSNSSFETVPINKEQYFTESLKEVEGVAHVQHYATKAGIVKTENTVQGVVLKGVDGDYQWDFFEKHLIEGNIPAITDSGKTNEVLLSKKLAQMLELSAGDSFIISFVPQKSSEGIRYRKFKIAGLFLTHMNEYDSHFIICDIKHIQRLNNWNDSLISGFEVLVNNYDRLREITEKVWDEVGYGFLKDGSKLKVETIEEKYPSIFDWLSLLDMNVIVILTLIIVVAGLNMVSGLLVIILEKTNMIGIMKAIGAENASIRKIFLHVGARLTRRGLLWGNILGIAACAIQHYTHLVPLDEATYFMPYVPIYLGISDIILVNIGSLAATMLMLLLPSFIISKIDPVNALRFD